MPGSRHGSGGAPSSQYLTPTSDNRGIPQWKLQQQQQQRPGMRSPQNNGFGHPQVRPPTVDEALQYSSLSSIVPHNPDIISLPTIGHSGFVSITSALSDHNMSRQSLAYLNNETLSNNGSSILLDEAVSKIRNYLVPEELTEFKFKTFTGASNRGRQAPATPDSSSHHQAASHLSPFADMILNSTDVAYRYPTPDTPSAKSAPKVHSPNHTPKKTFATPIELHDKARNHLPHMNGGDSHIRSKGVPVIEQKISSPMVSIPLPPPTFHHSEYITNIEAELHKRTDEVINKSSRKRKHAELERDDSPPSRIHDQKHISEEALRSLQDLIRDIFEAEDQLQPDTSGATSSDASKYFVLTDNAGYSDNPTLASWVHNKLEASLQKVISSGRFADIPVDHVSRLQKLCEGSLSLGEATALKIEVDWSEDDAESWRQNVQIAEAGLRSARTLLKIMIGGREEKQLYSEETLLNILNVLKHVVDSCIIPVVEARSTGSSSGIFSIASSHQSPLSKLLHQASKVARSLAGLLAEVEVAENGITTIEFLMARLVFVESAHSEKDAVLGTNHFEVLRRNATDVLAKIFAKYEDQRECIIGEILTSLEKLPQTRQSARHFKLNDGKNIQLVSALIMQLVQTSGSPSEERTRSRGKVSLNTRDAASYVRIKESYNHDDNDVEPSGSVGDTVEDTDPNSARNPAVAVHRLISVAQPLFDSASRTADYIIKFFIQRAVTSTKSGDQPYRNLLDIFTEDLLNVLSSPEWPAAELLLRCLLIRSIGIAESGTSTAPSKNMALELLGMMGSAISGAAASVRQLAKSVDHIESQLSSSLVQISDEYFEGTLQGKDLLTWEGPHCATLQYLQTCDLNNSQIRSAHGYSLMQWAMSLSTEFRPSSGINEGEHEPSNPGSSQVAIRLKDLMSNCRWVEADYGIQPVTTNQVRLAYGLTVLNAGFCKSFERILKILLESMSSEQATLRNRSLKSVVHMLEKDPTILDRGAYVVRLILKCASDPSSMVRDSALALIGKCILIKPALEADMCRSILTCTGDPAIGVRKRSMRLLRDIYLRSSRKDVKGVIAETLLKRVKDGDESVADLSRQIFEEIWLTPYHKLAAEGADSVTDKLVLREQVTLVIRTVKRGENEVPAMDSLLQGVLSNDSKNAPANFRVCKAMVATMFDGITHQEELPQSPEQQLILHTLTVFAKADAKLFTTDQLQHLQPYVENLSSADDLLLFRAVVVIFRYVLPHLHVPQSGFLGEIQTALLKSLPRLAEAELSEVVPCLWTISNVLKNNGKLVRTAISIFSRIPQTPSPRPATKDQLATLTRVKNYMRIAGYIGKYWDLENEQKAVQENFRQWKGNSVSCLMVDIITPYTSPEQPPWMRAMALESIGLICQKWPQHFVRAQVSDAFRSVFKEKNAEFQNIVLLNFRDFLGSQERRSEQRIDPTDTTSEAGKLGGPIGGGDFDGASALIAQQFLEPILRIALASQDEYGLTATQVLASISRQGLVHPKECGPALVALETSKNRMIADIAFQEHRTLHQQHESMFEREYMKAVREAFTYQRDVVKDPNGATTKPYAAKLCALFDVIKRSKAKYQKKFLSNLCGMIDFEPAKLDVCAEPPTHLQCAKFIVENIAFFEYGRIDELLHVVSCMEKVVTATGAVVAHCIQDELLNVQMEPTFPGTMHLPAQGIARKQQVDLQRLRQLATSSMILSTVWAARSFLRRLFNLAPSQQRRDEKVKPSAKDLNKAPIKVHGITGDRLWTQISDIMTGLSTPEAMMHQCKEFVDHLTLDNEFRVLDDDAEEDPGRFDTLSVDEDGDTQMATGGDSKPTKRRNPSVMSEMSKKGRRKGKPNLGGPKRSEASLGYDEGWP